MTAISVICVSKNGASDAYDQGEAVADGRSLLSVSAKNNKPVPNAMKGLILAHIVTSVCP